MKVFFGICLLISFNVFAKTFELSSSQISYQVDHTLKTVRGKSQKAKGKASCVKKSCEFLVAIKIKDFVSGNTNRDLHMWKIMKAELHPLIIGRFAGKIENGAMLNLEMSGNKGKVKIEDVTYEKNNNGINLKFSFKFKLSDYKIERPSLLTMAVKDSVLISVQSVWK